MHTPQITIVAGPSGAGKSTAAPALLSPGTPYVNADEIAKMLPGPGRDVQASRILLETWDTFRGQNASFATETTLASRSLAPRIRALKERGYTFHLYFFCLPDVDLAIARVVERVRSGGHDIPVETIRRRYDAGIRNFFELYQPLADEWRFYSNIKPEKPLKIAAGRYTETERVFRGSAWEQVRMGVTEMEGGGARETAPASMSEDAIDKRLRDVFRTAILDHKKKGNPICTWREGKVVWIQPKDIRFEEDGD